MRKMILRMKEQEKYEIIKELVDNIGNKLRATEKSGISVRHINRLIKKYKEIGIYFQIFLCYNLYNAKNIGAENFQSFPPQLLTKSLNKIKTSM